MEVKSGERERGFSFEDNGPVVEAQVVEHWSKFKMVLSLNPSKHGALSFLLSLLYKRLPQKLALRRLDKSIFNKFWFLVSYE